MSFLLNAKPAGQMRMRNW